MHHNPDTVRLVLDNSLYGAAAVPTAGLGLNAGMAYRGNEEDMVQGLENDTVDDDLELWWKDRYFQHL